jgi:hypothetical protein
MNVRELLKTEIWSRGITRRIFVGLGIVVAGLLACTAIELYWLTPGERKAAREAMAQIDTLQNFESISNSDFVLRDEHAKQDVNVAERAAWTVRDKNIATVVSMYLGMTEIDNESSQRQSMLEQKYPSLAQRAVEVATDGKKARLLNRLILHAALD